MKVLLNTMLFILLGITIKVTIASIDSVNDCRNGSFNCRCGSPPKESIETFLLQNQIMKPLNAPTTNCSSKIDEREFCASISCNFVPYTSTEKDNLLQSATVHKVKTIKRIQRETVLRSKGKKEPFVFKLSKQCNDTLKPIENAQTICKLSKDQKILVCDIKCAFDFGIREKGHVIKETKRVCYEKSPKPSMPVCEPYRNCQVVLVKSGDVNCVRSVKYPTYCHIACDADDKHAAIPDKRYKCAGKSFPERLPHCAALDENVALIRRPN